MKKSQPVYIDCFPNGPIDLLICLVAAIHFFVCNTVYSIADMFGMMQISVCDSIEAMADIDNGCEEMDITFPSNHTDQHNILHGYQKNSPVIGSNLCAGCNDGIVIWTSAPTMADCEEEVAESFQEENESLYEGCTYDGERAQECLNLINSSTCGELWSDSEQIYETCHSDVWTCS